MLNAGILYIYFTNFQKIDEEEYGGPWELTKEGFMTSFALFLVGILETKGVATKYFYDSCIFFKVGGVAGMQIQGRHLFKGDIYFILQNFNHAMSLNWSFSNDFTCYYSIFNEDKHTFVSYSL